MKILFCANIKEKQRVDMYLSTLFTEFSRSYIQKIIDKWNVFVNGIQITKNLKIAHKDQIEIQIIIEKSELQAENIPLDIVYEDTNFLLINKDPFLNVHPVPWEDWKKGTLVNALLYHSKAALPVINGEERPWIVHRLDKDTSGLILIAKNDDTMKSLQKIIHDREIEKYYIAITSWKIQDTHIKIESNIGRHPTDKIKMTTKNPIAPRYALTYGEVLGYIDDEYTVLKIKLETGRTHQIRVHLSSIGFPIIGDKVYGDKKINEKVQKKWGLTRQALHAYELKFNLFWKHYHFFWPIKEDMKKIIDWKIHLK